MIPPLPGDPRLPALGMAFDGPEVAAHLARRLAAWAEGAGDLGAFQATYVRYKPGTRCLVRFQAAVGEAAGGEPGAGGEPAGGEPGAGRPPAPSAPAGALGWTTPGEATLPGAAPAGAHDFFVVLYAGGLAERVAGRASLARLVERAARRHPAGPAARAAWLPELGAVAQVFPVDRQLPDLVRAAAPGPMRRVLGARVRSAAVVRHKPARKALVRYVLEGDGVEGIVYGKLHADGSGARAAAVGRRLVERGVPTPAPLHPPGPGAPPGLVLHAAAPGIPLRLAGRGAAAYRAWLPAAAEALARLHRAGTAPAQALAGLALPEVDPLRAAVAAGGMVAAVAPPLAGRVAALTGRLAAAWGDAARARALVHGDFYDDQVLVGGDLGAGGWEAGSGAWEADGDSGAMAVPGAGWTATLIDLDEVGWGDPAFDVANYAAHVSAWPAARGRGAETTRAAWLDLWPVADGRAEAARLRLEAAALLGVALEPFRGLWPDWPVEVERRLALAEARCLQADEAGRRRFGGGHGRRAAQQARPQDERGGGSLDAARPSRDDGLRPGGGRHPGGGRGAAPTAGADQPAPFLDPALPQLADLLDGRRASELLSRAAAEAGLGGPVHTAGITVVRHKPGRRCVIRYAVAANGREGGGGVGEVGEAEVWYGKTFASRRGARVLAAHRAIADAGALGPGVRVPRPIGYLADVDLCLLGAVPGRPVADALAAGDTGLAERIADAAAALHASGVALARRHALADELRPLAERVAGLAAIHPDLGPAARACLAAVMAAAGGAAGEDARGSGPGDQATRDDGPGWRWRPVHRDFYHDQVLVDDAGRLAVLDFDDAALSEPALDVANFSAHLRLLAEQRPGARAAIERCRAAFVARCIARDGALDGARLRLLEAATCLRLAAIHGPRADGRRVAEAMIGAGMIAAEVGDPGD